MYQIVDGIIGIRTLCGVDGGMLWLRDHLWLDLNPRIHWNHLWCDLRTRVDGKHLWCDLTPWMDWYHLRGDLEHGALKRGVDGIHFFHIRDKCMHKRHVITDL